MLKKVPKKVPKAYKILAIVLFFLYLFILAPTAQEQFTGVEKFLFLIIVPLFSSIFASSLFGFLVLGIKHFIKGNPKNQSSKEDSSPKIVEPEPQIEKNTDSCQDVSSLSAPDEVLSSMRKVFTSSNAQNCERIVEESLDIMRRTNNLDTFFSRSELAMQNALTLRQAEQAGVPDVHNTYEICQTVFETIQKKKLLALDSSFQSEKEKISELVNPQTKIKHWEQYLELLDKYMDEYNAEYSSEYLDIYSSVKNEIRDLKSRSQAPTPESGDEN